jgi:hypothetical protein
MTELHIPDEAIEALRNFDLVPDASRVDAIARPVLIAELRKWSEDCYAEGFNVMGNRLGRRADELEAER